MWVLIWASPSSRAFTSSGVTRISPCDPSRGSEKPALDLCLSWETGTRAEQCGGKKGQPGCDSLVPRQRAACFFTTSVPFLGCRPTYRPTAQARCSSRIWPCAVNFREGNLNTVTMVLFSAISCGENKERQLQGQLPGGGG